MNEALFLWFNPLAQAWPAALWSCLTVLGHSSMVFALLAPALLWRPALMTALLVCAPLAGAGVYVLKNIFLHARPPAVLAHDRFVQIGDALLLHSSFPSGHTTTAFAVATLSAVLVWRSNWQAHTRVQACMGLAVLAVLVGLSRMAVGAHWPQDVLAGAVLGALCGYASARTALIMHGKHWGWLNGRPYRLLQTGLVLMLSVSLGFIDMNYPLAQSFQWLTGLFGTAVAGLATWRVFKPCKTQA
jgi:membrane-associated phospholipid phosphatase